MIVIYLTINIAPELLPQLRPVPASVNHAILESIKPTPEHQAQLHQVDCPLCRDWTQWYQTPAKAKQGLGGHQSWCRRRK